MSNIINGLSEKYSIITLHGSSELYIQNISSLIELNTTVIKLKAYNEILVIEGDELFIEYLSQYDIKIKGHIQHIRFIEVLK